MECKYFKIEEFDDPNIPDSAAENMDYDFISLLNKIRHESGVPMRVTSGWRSKETTTHWNIPFQIRHTLKESPLTLRVTTGLTDKKSSPPQSRINVIESAWAKPSFIWIVTQTKTHQFGFIAKTQTSGQTLCSKY